VTTREHERAHTTPTAAGDAQFVRAALSDRDLFWQLYERYVDAIFWYALPRTGSAAASDDIVSETMLAAFERLESFDANKGSFATWLFVIARRKIIDRQRAHRRLWRYVRSHGPGSPTASEDLLAGVLRDEEIAAVYAAYEQLSSADQEIVALRYSAGLSTREISGVLGISDAAARQRLSRARSRLATHMNGKSEDE
jgi:RNA polymerase sigma-70 factor (ECF subfamily)